MERLGELRFKGFPYCMLFSLKATFLSQEVCYQYWPADDTKGVQKYGEFTVSVLQATKHEDGFVVRNISIANPKVMEWDEESRKRLACGQMVCYLLHGTYVNFIPYISHIGAGSTSWSCRFGSRGS